MGRRLHIDVESLEEMGRDFVDTWRRVERGEALEPRETLSFPDVEGLFRTLSPVRWRLLRVLRQQGPLSVRALAKVLARDYKNVHRDVGVLGEMGLIERAEDDRVHVPWDEIVSHVDLKAA